MEISKHGYERSRERFKLTKNATDKLASKALMHGIDHREATGALRTYFDSLFMTHGKGNNNRIYAEKVFIFDDEFLITIFHLPNEFKRLVRKTMHKRIDQ